MSENTDLFVVKTWLEDSPEHYSVSLPHPEEEAKDMRREAEDRPRMAAEIEPFTGQVAGQH